MFTERRAALLAEKEQHIKAARAIAEKAESQGRDFTSDERKAIDQHVAAARGLKTKLEKAGDDALIAELNALGSPVHGRRARGDGMWSKAMTDHLGRVGAKALTTTGSISVPSISSSITTIGDRPRSILELIPFEPLGEGDQYGFIRETLRTHNATTVAVGKKKPESVYTLEKVSDTVKTIAHLATVDRTLVEDVALLREYLETALRDGVLLELEDQVLNGNGSTAGNLDDMVGILNVAGTQAQAWDTDRFVTARKAVTKLENVHGIDLDGVAWVLSPAEWEAFELATSANHYLLGDPGTPGNTPPIDRARRRLWGYPVTTTTAMADGTGLLGDFAGSIEIREREDVVVQWAQTGYVEDLFGAGLHGDLWEANKVRFRAEGRWGEAIKRPLAFVEVDLTAV